MGHFTSLVALSLALAPAGVQAASPEAAEPYAASRNPAVFDRSLECLTQAIYYEARSQSDDGQRAVAQVVLNRVRHPHFPNSVCGVVYQGSARHTGCQFTFTCDGSMNRAIQQSSWARARQIASSALEGDVYRPVGLATNYHTTAIHPYWAPTLVPQTIVGAHIFYRLPGSNLDSFSQAPSDDEPDAGWNAPLRFAAPRLDGGGGNGGFQMRSGVRVRYAMPQMEIPVVERPVVYRSLGQRPLPQRATANARMASVRDGLAGGTGAGAVPARASLRPAALTRTGPRVVMEGGVRVSRGS